MVYDSRAKFISIIVEMYRTANFSLQVLADKMHISLNKLNKWMANSPDLAQAMMQAVSK